MYLYHKAEKSCFPPLFSVVSVFKILYVNLSYRSLRKIRRKDYYFGHGKADKILRTMLLYELSRFVTSHKLIPELDVCVYRLSILVSSDFTDYAAFFNERQPTDGGETLQQ